MLSNEQILSFLQSPFHDKFNTLQRVWARLKGIVYYRHIFATFGKNSLIFKPLLISNPRFVHIGSDVLIRGGSRIEAIVGSGNRIPMLSIGNNVNIEQNVHLVCHSRLLIQSNVSITGNCTIVDVTHPYTDLDDPRKIGDRILDEDSFVEIGEDSFLGFGTVVMPNVRIGRHCVIGAHSVVTRSIPDYSVAAGCPARVIKRYDAGTGKWQIVRDLDATVPPPAQVPIVTEI